MTNPWKLPEREAQVVSLLVNEARGCNKKIAARMGIDKRTVDTYLNRAYKKMGVANRIQAALMWDRWLQGARAQGNLALVWNLSQRRGA